MKKILAFVFLLSLISCNPIEYDIFGTIEGTVVDSETFEPIGYVSVDLSPGSKNVITSDDGKFVFDDLDAQQYSLSVHKNGYESNIRTVKVLSGETSEVMITIKKMND